MPSSKGALLERLPCCWKQWMCQFEVNKVERLHKMMKDKHAMAFP